MALNSLFCADVPLSNYSLAISDRHNLIATLFFYAYSPWFPFIDSFKLCCVCCASASVVLYRCRARHGYSRLRMTYMWGRQSVNCIVRNSIPDFFLRDCLIGQHMIVNCRIYLADYLHEDNVFTHHIYNLISILYVFCPTAFGQLAYFGAGVLTDKKEIIAYKKKLFDKSCHARHARGNDSMSWLVGCKTLLAIPHTPRSVLQCQWKKNELSMSSAVL